MPREIELLGCSGLQISDSSDMADDAAAVVWDSALVLLHYLSKRQREGRCLVSGRPVLELGSGTGVVGLAAAALGASSVALTDLSHVLPNIQRNIQANQAAIGSARVAALPLSWGDPAHLREVWAWFGQAEQHHQSSAPFNLLVLASDLAYESATLPALTKVLRSCLQGQTQVAEDSQGQGQACSPQQRILLAYEEREGMDELWEEALAASKLEAHLVPEEEQHEDWRTPEIKLYWVQACSPSWSSGLD
eukprot:CAMPEP_0119105744 /NCGR_PEP_ID=MMETSP1180-20130426/3629_1 /TAXON_ID=3052 ORGANISM="Chlamydomonas cf sp, Strain CCMP681" /NCGR_SAMPLE_ID=MMETSP1180 /ASSEMBLY_ACC=CAM_ASM_000741 /LENGTH=248 /DNA_ID=CAMNT_0007090883 /DNA_START=39 /DNA_END=785 /DNA_ORIENTATION=-